MQAYLHTFKVIADQLAACGAPMSDDDMIIHILEGLPNSYRQFNSSIRICACTSLLTLEELHMLLICEEMSVAEEPSPTSNVALYAARPNKPQHNRNPP